MKKVKYRRSLVANIIVIFLIFNIISILLFSWYTSKKAETRANQYAKNSMQEIVDEKSEVIALTFNRIVNQTEQMAVMAEKLLENGNVSDELTDEYTVNDDGTISRRKDQSKPDYAQSNIFVANNVDDMPDMIRQINLTGDLDEAFEKVVVTTNVQWVYLVTRDNLLRCSPFVNLKKYFKKDHTQVTDTFYIEANEKNNPERKAIWTKPYIDYLGKGWTMTCSHPIYDEKDEFFGVVCVDLPINSVKENYFSDFKLGETGIAYWLTEEGELYYNSEDPKPTNDQGIIYEKNIFDQNMGKEKTKAVEKALHSKSGNCYYTENGDKKLMTYSRVGETGSVILVEMSLREFQTTSGIDASGVLMLTCIDLVFAVLVGLLFLKRISMPIQSLVKRAKKISEGDYSVISSENEDDYYEIDQLNRAFNKMNDSIDTYIIMLLERNQEINTILDTIDETLLIVNREGNILVKSKEMASVSDEDVRTAIDKFRHEKQSYSEEVITDTEVFENTYYPIYGDKNELDKIVISSKCITQDLLIEKEMLQIEKMAGIGQISAAIVHELKNKLALIKGAAYIINMVDETEQNKKETEIVMQAVEDAENVITTLLDFSKRDADGGEMIHLGTIIRQILLLSKKRLSEEVFTSTW